MTKRKQCAILALTLMLGATAAHALENGVYRDQADGYGGKVILTVIVRDGRIQSVETENTGGEKSEYYRKAEEAMIPAIIKANGTDGVDTVAGATGTSESILNAMEGILEQAAYNGMTQGVVQDVKNAVKDAGQTVQDAGNAVNDAAEDAVNSVKEPTLTPEPKPTA